MVKLNSKGFTLIEVMLAMAVFSIVGVALVSTANTNFTNTTILEEKMLSSWLASNQLVEASLDKKWPPKNKKGQIEFANRTWFWQQTIKKTASDDLRAIEIAIRKNEKDEKPISSLLTYVTKDEP